MTINDYIDQFKNKGLVAIEMPDRIVTAQRYGDSGNVYIAFTTNGNYLLYRNETIERCSEIIAHHVAQRQFKEQLNELIKGDE